jgi:arylsulfatase A-like enzyme
MLPAMLPTNCRRFASLGIALGAGFLPSTFGAPIPSPSTPTSVSRPNIIFILADDLGYGDVGAFYQDSRPESSHRLLTPNLDRMASEGMMLMNHYCGSPVCAPSRGSILTGVSQGHCDIRDNQFDRPLPPNHTLGTVLQAAGYTTVTVGKWGVGGTDAPWPAHPLNRGFNEFYGFLRHTDAHDHYPGNSGGIFDGFTEVTNGLDGAYSADLFTARAKWFIVNHVTNDRNRPFFLYLAYTLPHWEMQLPPGPYPETRGLHGGMQWPLDLAAGHPDSYIYPEFRDKPWPDNEKRHASMVRRLDDCVGDILQLLRDLGIEHETFVVFTSDNGPHNEGNDPRFFDSWGPFDGIKRDLFEGGGREPTFIWWPGTVPAGQRSAEISAQYDWMATFADAAGVPVPARIDGISLLPALTGHPDVQLHHEYLYCEYLGRMEGPVTKEILGRHHYQQRGQEQYIRIGDFVGLRYQIKSPDDPLRLYNVVNDPKELQDLSNDPANRSLLARMRDLLVTARTPDPAAPRPYDSVLLPNEEPSMATREIAYSYFKGHWPWLPAFRMMRPTDTGTIGGWSYLMQDAETSGEDYQGFLRELIFRVKGFTMSEAFGVEYKGSLSVPANGKYEFTIQSDSGVDFWIHDDLVVDDDYNHDGLAQMPRSGTVLLRAGWHPFRLDYRHSLFNGRALLKVTVKGPGREDGAMNPETPGGAAQRTLEGSQAVAATVID